MPSALIGITTFRVTLKSGAIVHGVTQTYVRSLLRAGATPVLLPLDLPEAALADLLPRLDGVLFTGGGDVHPRQYASQMHPLVSGVDEDRDRIELQLVQAVISSETPFLGICRGIQVINVAMGGNLYEDMLDQRPGTLRHGFFDPSPRDFLAHPVKIEPGSRLSQLLGVTDAQVNSIHHQGIRAPAPNVQVTALAPDGVIEAIELPGHPFGLAVQWHPECLPDDPSMQRLFKGFVQAAEK